MLYVWYVRFNIVLPMILVGIMVLQQMAQRIHFTPKMASHHTFIKMYATIWITLLDRTKRHDWVSPTFTRLNSTWLSLVMGPQERSILRSNFTKLKMACAAIPGNYHQECRCIVIKSTWRLVVCCFSAYCNRI